MLFLLLGADTKSLPPYPHNARIKNLSGRFLLLSVPAALSGYEQKSPPSYMSCAPQHSHPLRTDGHNSSCKVSNIPTCIIFSAPVSPASLYAITVTTQAILSGSLEPISMARLHIMPPRFVRGSDPS